MTISRRSFSIAGLFAPIAAVASQPSPASVPTPGSNLGHSMPSAVVPTAPIDVWQVLGKDAISLRDTFKPEHFYYPPNWPDLEVLKSVKDSAKRAWSKQRVAEIEAYNNSIRGRLNALAERHGLEKIWYLRDPSA